MEMSGPNLNDEAILLKKEIRRQILLEILKIIDNIFDGQRITVAKRLQKEQDIIGPFFIVVESDLKDTIKKMI